MRADTRDAARRAFSNMARGTIGGSQSDKGVQTLDVKLLKNEGKMGVEDFSEPYGFTSNPLPGAATMVAFLGGNRTHAVVVGKKDRRHRPRGMAAGEVAVYDNQGQTVLLAKDKLFVWSPDKKVVVQYGEDVSVTLEEGKATVKVQGNVVVVKPRRIDLGADPAPFRMMTEAGPSNAIYGVLSVD